jgi:hypothetical protein
LYAVKDRLDKQQACLKSGKRVYNIYGALRWLLESIGTEVTSLESCKNP